MCPSGRSQMQQRQKALTERWHFRTFQIYLPIQRHQQLNSFQLGAMARHRSARMHKLVGHVFYCVAKDFKSAARLGGNTAAALPTLVLADHSRCWWHDTKACLCGTCHVNYPLPLFRRTRPKIQMTNVLWPKTIHMQY